MYTETLLRPATLPTAPTAPPAKTKNQKLKFWIFSDLHVDVGHNDARYSYSFPSDRPDHRDDEDACDAVLIAGDIREDLVKSLKWIANSNFKKPVFYVAGNHDYWRGDLKDYNEDARRFIIEHNFKQPSEDTKIYFLYDGGFTIFKKSHLICGGTLWTDYLLHGESQKFPSMQAAQFGMNDHRKITYGYRKFSTQDALDEFKRTKEAIDAALNYANDAELTPVVVTHHAPSEQSVNDKYAGDNMNPAYASSLEDVARKADLWVHGHMHDSSDYEIYNCRVICNPRGYATNYDLNQHFDPVLVVAV
jgi:predicted phosphodiesterase